MSDSLRRIECALAARIDEASARIARGEAPREPRAGDRVSVPFAEVVAILRRRAL